MASSVRIHISVHVYLLVRFDAPLEQRSGSEVRMFILGSRHCGDVTGKVNDCANIYICKDKDVQSPLDSYAQSYNFIYIYIG